MRARVFIILILLLTGAAPAIGVQPRRASSPTPQPTPTPVAGIPVTIEGTIFALSCLLDPKTETTELARCSRASLANGASVAILESDSGRIMGIAAESAAGAPAGKAREFIAESVRIQGRIYRRAGFSILVPESIEGIPAAQPENGRRSTAMN